VVVICQGLYPLHVAASTRELSAVSALSKCSSDKENFLKTLTSGEKNIIHLLFENNLGSGEILAQPDDTIGDVKEQIQAKLLYRVQDQALYLLDSNTPLTNDKSLTDCNINEDFILHFKLKVGPDEVLVDVVTSEEALTLLSKRLGILKFLHDTSSELIPELLFRKDRVR
jgi:hypothetical protein